MTVTQRVILAIAAGFFLLFAFGTMVSTESDAWLASVQFLVAVGLLVFAARKPTSGNPN